MDDRTIYLEGDDWDTEKRWFRWSQAALGVIFILQGLNPEAPFSFFRFVLIGYGCFLLAAMLFYPKFAMWRFIQFNEEGIQGRLSLRKTIALPWSSIASIEARMFTLFIRTKEGAN